MGQLPEFEELVELANKDPEAFETFRQQTCQKFIRTTPDTRHHRLMAIQNRVEVALDRAKTPMAGLLSVSSMMHDSFYQLTTKMQEVDLISRGQGYQLPVTTEPTATVINFGDWKAQAESPSKTPH